MIRVITPEMYHNSRTRRRVANGVFARSGLSQGECDDMLLMKLVRGRWWLHMAQRNERGHLYVRNGRIARRSVYLSQ